MLYGDKKYKIEFFQAFQHSFILLFFRKNRMKLLTFFAAVLMTVNASTDKDQWVAFKQTHGKTYKSLLEERTRFGIFQNNLRTIEKHNARYEEGQETYYMAVTRFADMTKDEFRKKLGLQNKKRPNLNATLKVFPKNLELPEKIDWTEKEAVLLVKDQGQCGSCWAFSATGSLEGQNAIHNKVKTPLSEQQLLDCSSDYGNGDCDEGGLMTNAFEYIRDYGIESESSYPYVAEQNDCQYDANKTILKIKGYNALPVSEDELRKAVGTVGPISVGMSAENLQMYDGGVLDEPCFEGMDHGVLVVGYGEYKGKKFWKVKNSWGNDWGEDGFFRIARDENNLCDIASMCSYPTL